MTITRRYLLRALLAFALLSGLATLGGCISADPDESTIPQSRPAEWEYDRMPGQGR